MSAALRVAVAEDEKDTREFLREALARLGHEVTTAACNGKELLQSLRTKPPDLIITDVRMPLMDGIEAALAINVEQPIPVILISAHHDTDILARVNADYIMGYVVKPVNEADLKAAIALAMARFRQFTTLMRETATLRQALEDRKIIERAKGIVMKRLRVDEDEAFRRLRKHASDQNFKLVEVGQKVICSEEVFAQLDRL